MGLKLLLAGWFFGMGGIVLCGDKPIATVFSAPPDKVYAATLETLTAEWFVTQADKESGVIAFTANKISAFVSGNLKASAVIAAHADGASVTVNSELRGSPLESKLRKKAVRLIGERLFKDGLIPETQIPKK